MSPEIQVGSATIGRGHPLALIAGPCVIEGVEHTLELATRLRDVCAAEGIPLVFKASFDKANRTSIHSFRGPGLRAGLDVLGRVKAELGLAVTTDVHLPSQAQAVAEVVDLVQIPAFLSRQTDLLVACAGTDRPLNIKKGQFLAPWDMGQVVAKAESAGAAGVMLTERGTTFGYNELVNDLRAIPEMQGLGVPVCFDATHSVQRPGAGGTTTAGRREHVPALARAAVAAGADAVFMEVHPEPDRALSDAGCQLPLADLGELLRTLRRIATAVGR